MSPEVSTGYTVFSSCPKILSSVTAQLLKKLSHFHLKGGCNNEVMSQAISSYHIVNAKYVLIQQEYGERAQRIKIYGECSGAIESFNSATMFTIA